MSDTPPPSRDPHRQAALDWWLRLQERPDDPALREQLRQWLETDPMHRMAFEKVRRVWLLSGALDFGPEIAPRRRRRARLRLGVACAAGIVLVVAVLARLVLAPDWQSGYGEHLHVRLEDGSQVLLAGDSAFDVRYDAGTRRIVLRQGRAFFDVQPDPARPFIVEAAPLRVQVTGTRFEVALYASQISVEVASGSVQVEGRQAQGTAALMAGQRLSLPRNVQAWTQETVPVEWIATWRNRQLLVRDQPLEVVVEQLRPYLPGLVVLPDAALAGQRLTARLDLHEPLQALHSAVSAAGGRVHVWSPYLLVVAGR